MADTWGGSWGSSWGFSWGASVTPSLPPVTSIYGDSSHRRGISYRARQSDVDDLVRLLFPKRKKRRKVEPEPISREAFEAAVLKLIPSDEREPVEQVVIDYSAMIVGAQRQQADVARLIAALLARVEQEIALAMALDEEDVELLLLAG